MREPRSTEFHFVRRGSEPVPAVLTERRRVRTIEGRLARSPWARPLAVALLFTGVLASAELATLFVSARAGIIAHSSLLLATITAAALMRRARPGVSDLLVALTPVPLIRIVGLTSPLMQFSYIQWFTLIAIILYAGIVTSIKILQVDLRSLGLRLPALRHLPLEAVVILMGFGFGWLEYQILRPGALVEGLTFRQLAAPILVLFISTGLLEELLFRGLIQRYAGISLGAWPGIALTTVLFGIMHIGWASILDVFFVMGVGLIYSLVVRRTGSILGVSISHAITNTTLFLVMPLLAAG